MSTRKTTGSTTRRTSRATSTRRTALKVVTPEPEEVVPEPVAAEPAAAPGAETEMAPANKGPDVPMLRKRILVERVVERTGLNKSTARTAIAAATEVMAEALRAGETVDAGALGKLRVTRTTGEPGAERLVLRTRLPRPDKGEGAGTDPLANDDEEG
ncbi:MAG: HU family DNA-binding protein [Rhodobacteraceae bacterium]|nr:HU family DNA-binding protein [Paracoccaceae bacterium]